MMDLNEAIERGNALFEALGDEESREERAQIHAWYLEVRELLTPDQLYYFDGNPPARPAVDRSYTKARTVLWHQVSMLQRLSVNAYNLPPRQDV